MKFIFGIEVPPVMSRGVFASGMLLETKMINAS